MGFLLPVQSTQTNRYVFGLVLNKNDMKRQTLHVLKQGAAASGVQEKAALKLQKRFVYMFTFIFLYKLFL